MKLTAATTLLFLAAVAGADAADPDILPVDNDDWLHQCVQAFQTHFVPNSPQPVALSNHNLIKEPSGLCADALTCAFDQCRGWEQASCYTLGAGIDPYTSPRESYVDLQSQTFDEAMETCGVTTPSALPGHITFPKTAGDVVAAVKYAAENGLQVSVQSTGHCYTGCNTKAGTLMINLRDLVKYAQGDDAIVECDDPDASDDGDACVLALARGRGAYIRVGGGQTWSDVYNAMIDASDAGSTSKPYGVGGGGAGSVGAAGGWLQGGGLSTGYERTYGIGVDQILEIEVVLPNAAHVKIFPSSWDVVEGYLYPQTKKVTAWCNANVSGDETEWSWQPCTDEELAVSPEDLWKAIRGGGGGTYGIVTSVKYQLFDQKPFQWFLVGKSAGTPVSEDQDVVLAKLMADEQLLSTVSRMYTMFLADLLFNPASIGISEELSLHTGAPELDFRISGSNLFYWGEGDFFGEVLPAWNLTVDSAELEDEELTELLKTSMFWAYPSPFKSYSDFAKAITKMVTPNYDEIYGQNVPDSPPPQFVPSKSYDRVCSFNLPLPLLQSSDENDRDLVFKLLGTNTAGHVTGGLVAKTGDGMDSVPPSERISGQSSADAQDAIDKYDIFGDLVNAVYKSTGSDGPDSSFPGYFEYNHICPGATTPSRSDWTKECDPEKDGDCFSIQEAIWGSQLYGELQAIKAAVDASNMLDCYPCVKHPSPEESPATTEATTPSDTTTTATAASETTKPPAKTTDSPTPAPTVSGSMSKCFDILPGLVMITVAWAAVV